MNGKAEHSGEPKKLQAEHYFDEVERMIVSRLHSEADSPEGRADLVRSTGIHDPLLIEELSRLGITADAVIALRLFPLVLVAWAEDSSGTNERTAVMAEALRLGITEDSSAWILLEEWLKHPPRGLTVDAWKRYTQSLFCTMSRVARRRLIDFTEQEMTAIAKASGGHFGIGKISKKESTMIQKLVSSMQSLSESTLS